MNKKQYGRHQTQNLSYSVGGFEYIYIDIYAL